jgi:hypothetical protein
MVLIQPVLAFNVANANSELKRLNELLFKELLANYGEKLFALFDDKCAELVHALVGHSANLSQQQETANLVANPVLVAEQSS